MNFNCENILAAISCAHILGVQKNTIEKGIKKCVTVPGRMEYFRIRTGAKIVIDYAHTPDAYEKVLLNIKD